MDIEQIEKRKKEKQAYDKIYYRNNIEKIKAYTQTRKAHMVIYGKIYREEHKEERKIKRRIYQQIRYKKDPKFKIDCSMRTAIGSALNGEKNYKCWFDLVGYTVDDLKKHLEKRFTKGMSWELFLQGKIHIDHKVPKSVFNYSKPEHEDFKKCWALKNLQPLWAKDNMEKHAKLTKHFQPSLLL